MLVYILLFASYISTFALVLNNFTTIGFFIYTWNTGVSLSQALWDSFILYISTWFLAGVILLMSILSLRALDKSSYKYSRRK